MEACLLIFPKFSIQHILIPHHTFINFIKKSNQCTYSILYDFPIVSFSLGGTELLHKLFQTVMIGQIYSLIYKNSELLRTFPPNTLSFLDFSIQYNYSIPYVYISGANVQPTRLFHTPRLLDTLE